MSRLDCKVFRELFSEYYDGYTPGKGSPGEIPRTEIKAHLDECAECAVAYKEYVQLLGEVRALPMLDIPEGFHEGLMDYVAENKHRPERGYNFPNIRARSIKRRVIPISTMAAVLLFAIVWVSGIFNQTPIQNGHESIEPFGIAENIGEVDEFTGPEGRILLPSDGYVPPMAIMGILDIADIEYLPEDDPPGRISNATWVVVVGIILIVSIGSVIFIRSRIKK